MKLTISIDMGNAAFGDDPQHESARILENLAERLRSGEVLIDDGDTYPMIDFNGNRVGMAAIEGGDA